jgi:hypothetical protein
LRNILPARAFLPPIEQAAQEDIMADNSGGGGIGVLGVLVGALIVIVVGGGLLFATGKIGGKDTATLKIEMPKVTTGSSAK